MMNMWATLRDVLFSPKQEKTLLWSSIAPLFIFASAAIALIAYNPFFSIVLMLAVALQVASLLVKQPPAILTMRLAVGGFVLYLFQQQPKELLAWNFAWVSTVAIAVALQSEFFRELFATQGEARGEVDEALKSVELWKSRFETVKEKMLTDREVLEKEIEEATKMGEEETARMQSYEKLLRLSHQELKKAEEHAFFLDQEIAFIKTNQKPQEPEAPIDEIFLEAKPIDQSEMSRIMEELNDLRVEYHQMEILLAERTRELEEQKMVVEQRQKRNELLLSKSKEHISLQDLTRK